VSRLTSMRKNNGLVNYRFLTQRRVAKNGRFRWILVSRNERGFLILRFSAQRSTVRVGQRSSRLLIPSSLLRNFCSDLGPRRQARLLSESIRKATTSQQLPIGYAFPAAVQSAPDCSQGLHASASGENHGEERASGRRDKRAARDLLVGSRLWAGKNRQSRANP
jgi:hypothetical protein